MAIARDPLVNRYVKSLARPEANITGASNTVSPEIIGKRMQLPDEMLPDRPVIGLIWNPKSEGLAGLVAFAEQVAKSVGNQTISLPLQGPEELQGVLEKAVEDHVGALLVMPDPVEFDHRREIIDFTVAKRIPAMHPYPEEAEEGALAAYGQDWVTSTDDRLITWTKFSREWRLPISLCFNPRSLNLSSTSRPRKRSTSQSRLAFSLSPTR